MKIQNRIFFAALAGVLGVLSPSCSSENSDLVDDQTLGHCLTYARDLNSRAQTFCRLSYLAQFNYTNSTADFSIVGLVLPQAGSTSGKAYPRLNFVGLPWAYNASGWKEIDVDNVRPVITGMADAPMFKKLNFKLLDSFDGERYAPGIIYKYLISDGGDDIEAVGCCMTGRTVSVTEGAGPYVPEEDASVTDDRKPVYWVDCDFKEKKASIYIYNAKFLGPMPSLNMVFPDVDLIMSEGELTLSSPALVPECGGVPYPTFPISQLSGKIDFTAGMTLSFHCGFRGTDYTVDFEGKY